MIGRRPGRAPWSAAAMIACLAASVLASCAADSDSGVAAGGIRLELLPISIGPTAIAELRAGRAVSTASGRVVIDPRLDDVLTVGVLRDGSVDVEASSLRDRLGRSCSEERRRFAILAPAADARYRDVIAALGVVLDSVPADCVVTPILGATVDRDAEPRERRARPGRTLAAA